MAEIEAVLQSVPDDIVSLASIYYMSRIALAAIDEVRERSNERSPQGGVAEGG